MCVCFDHFHYTFKIENKNRHNRPWRDLCVCVCEWEHICGYLSCSIGTCKIRALLLVFIHFLLSFMCHKSSTDVSVSVCCLFGWPVVHIGNFDATLTVIINRLQSHECVCNIFYILPNPSISSVENIKLKRHERNKKNLLFSSCQYKHRLVQV